MFDSFLSHDNQLIISTTLECTDHSVSDRPSNDLNQFSQLIIHNNSSNLYTMWWKLSKIIANPEHLKSVDESLTKYEGFL